MILNKKKPKILIIGSTGKLGSLLLNYTLKKNIPIFAITCFHNTSKLKSQSKKYKVKNIFTLSNMSEKKSFLSFLQKKIDIIYFLDFGSLSLKYLKIFNKFNKYSHICIANKEMIIAGGAILNNQISKSKNMLIPLDSEHFSLLNSNTINTDIDKIYITASGGPFYFKKNIDLNKVRMKNVLSHPKWSMGFNNLIDSSNFINKILEIFELQHTFNIDIKKIDFLISPNAYIHSLILYKDSKVTINCFENNMLIPLLKPLMSYYDISLDKKNKSFLNSTNFTLFERSDSRFKIFKYIQRIKNLSHAQQIKFLILNNKAQKMYLNNSLKYNDIVPYIFKYLNDNKKNHIKLLNFDNIIDYIDVLERNY